MCGRAASLFGHSAYPIDSAPGIGHGRAGMKGLCPTQALLRGMGGVTIDLLPVDTE